MGATLDALYRLQEVELQIMEVRQRIQRKQRDVKRQEKRIADLDARIRSEEAALRADQMEADRLDLDMKVCEVDIVKLRQVLNTAKTNKEYSAILTQLNTTKANNSKVEERVLTIFNQLEARRKQMAVIQEERGNEVARLEALNAATRQAEEKAEDRLARLGEERRRAAAIVPGAALQVFDRVAERLEGEAMVAAFRTHVKREEYACEGCNMSVTLEQINTILSRDEAVLCNSCGRILYLESPA